MKKNKFIVALFGMLMLCISTIAQDDLMTKNANVSVENIVESEYPFVKKVAATANGLSAIVYGKTKEVQEVIDTRFKERADAKVKSFKGDVYVVEGAVYEAISPMKLDYYYRINQAASENPNKTKVTLFLAFGNDNFLTSEKNAEEIQAAKKWLAELNEAVQVSQLKIQEEAQAKIVKELVKEQEDATKANTKLVDEKAGLESDLQKKKVDVEKLQSKIAEIQSEIEGFNAKMMEDSTQLNEVVRQLEESNAAKGAIDEKVSTEKEKLNEISNRKMEIAN